MENIIAKLSEIETTASSIMEDVTTQKRKLAEAMDVESQAFDIETDKDTAQELDKIRQKLEIQKETALTDLKDKTDAMITTMENYYQEHHTELATAVYNKLIRM